MQKRWFIKTSPESSQIKQIQQELKISDLMSAMLVQRGLTTAAEIRSYFNPEISGLHDPFLMLNMGTAVERLVTAIDKSEKILVYGDYDVDGTTSVALMYSVLGEFADVAYYIPDRYDEGYGLSRKGVEHAAELGINLLITLDCGIKEVANIAYAKELGLDVIVCDHHTPGEILPDAIILDPKQADCMYPYKDLCGCGVGYKLLEGLFESKEWGREKLLPYLDLVMIAIGADIVPVTGENRAICKYGLKLINENPRIGIEALVEVAGKSFPLTLTSVVFTIAPRINAAGRLKTGCRSVELLIADNKKQAKEISEEIDNYNKERRELDSTITQEALELVTSETDFENKKSTVVFKEDWHKGVVGIVASRLIEHHYRPTIVLTESHGKITGSARTAGDFNVYEAILACEHLLEKFGGHQHAAGLTLDPGNLEAFKNAFEKEVSERMTREFEVEELIIDHEIAFSDLFLAGESIFQVPRIVKMQDQMEPFGPQNQQPVFIVKSVYAKSYRILKEAHLKVDVIDTRSGISISGIGFNMADKEHLVAEGCAFDCVFTLETNTWNDRSTLQLQVRDIRETV